MKIIEFLESFGFSIKILIPGFLAGIISAKHNKEKGIANYTFRAFVGALIANYLTPIIVNKTGIEYEYSIAFFLGLISMELLKHFIQKWQQFPLTRDLFKHSKQ